MFSSRRAAAILLMIAGIWLPATAVAGDKEDVRAADLRRISALMHGDRAGLEAVLADELTYGHADGRFQTKTELLAALTAGVASYQSYDGPPPSVRIQENVALLSGIAEIEATARGTKGKLWLRYLAVYVKRDGAWLLVAYQSTRLEQPPAGLR
ncbi:MAG: nuclear transport factor 2 family protein [Nibricoccus sp.]